MVAPGRILIVCTGNVCRSPYIERMLVARLQELGIEVESAGTRALVGRPMEPGSQHLLELAGVGADDFVARQLTPEMAREADLVLTATRDHRREVAQLEPRALRYTHAVDDFSDLVAGAELREPVFMEPPDASVVGALAARAAARRSEVAARLADASGIVDPFRQSERVFARMAEQVAAVLPPIVEAARQVAASD